MLVQLLFEPELRGQLIPESSSSGLFLRPIIVRLSPFFILFGFARIYGHGLARTYLYRSTVSSLLK
jgi:hypothetical protein